MTPQRPQADAGADKSPSLSEVVATTLGEKVALGAMIAGGVAAIVGTIFYVRAVRKRTSTLRSALGEVKSRTHAGGMTLTHHYDPDMPIQQRVGILQDLVWKGVQHPQMRELALAITGNGERSVTVGKRTFKVKGAGCPARDKLCEAEAIYSWVKREIRYGGDVAPVRLPDGKIEGVDLFQSGLRSAEMGAGDCDDHAVLGATLLALNGISTRFRITAPTKSSDWAHIYLIFSPSSGAEKWIPMDTTLPGNMFGREAGAAKKIEFPI